MSVRGVHPTDFQNSIPSELSLKIKMWTFLDSCSIEDIKCAFDKPAPNAVPTAGWVNCQMVDVSTSAIVPGQNRANHLAVGCSNKAHARVAVEISLDALTRVGIAQTDAITLLPQGEDIVI